MNYVIIVLNTHVQNDEQLLVQTMMTQHGDGTVKISQDVISVKMNIQIRVMVYVNLRHLNVDLHMELIDLIYLLIVRPVMVVVSMEV